MSDSPVCPYCDVPAVQMRGDDVYPGRRDLRKLTFWVCQRCTARVGCHRKTGKPLGTLANAELRNWRMKAHNRFDPLWKRGPESRTAAYLWLAEQLNIDVIQCHIALFDIDTCQQVIKLATAKLGEYAKDGHTTTGNRYHNR